MRYKGTRGDDVLVGTDRNDVFFSSGGHDAIDGGLGHDVLKVDFSADGLHWNGSYVRVEQDGTLTGSLNGNYDHGIEFKNIEELEFTGITYSPDYVIVRAEHGMGTAKLTLEGGIGVHVDTLDIEVGQAVDRSFVVRDDGSVDTDLLTATGFERYVIAFGGGDDVVRTGDQDDELSGGSGDDSLAGGTGDDLLIGGRGSDLLSGGEGADTFRYGRLGQLTVGHDRIVDFDGAAGDRIDLKRVDADPSTDGKQRFTFIGSDAFTGAGGSAYEVRVSSRDGVSTVEGDVNHDGVADFSFSVSSAQPVTATDFVL
jgi:Ca2+-binding RTX toxin-like protein